jgi:hypothetical protein
VDQSPSRPGATKPPQRTPKALGMTMKAGRIDVLGRLVDGFGSAFPGGVSVGVEQPK